MTSDVRISKIIAPHFYDVHRAIKNHEYTHYILDGGRGSTKSSFAGTEVILELIRNPNIHAIILRKVKETLRESVYTQVLWAIEQLGLTHEFKVTVSPMEITRISTGQMYLMESFII